MFIFELMLKFLHCPWELYEVGNMMLLCNKCSLMDFLFLSVKASNL